MAFCIQCGSALEDNWSFCENCGAPVNSRPSDSQTTQFSNQPEEQQTTVNNKPAADPQLSYDSSQNPPQDPSQNGNHENSENSEVHKVDKTRVIIAVVVAVSIVMLPNLRAQALQK